MRLFKIFILVSLVFYLATVPAVSAANLTGLNPWGHNLQMLARADSGQEGNSPNQLKSLSGGQLFEKAVSAAGASYNFLKIDLIVLLAQSGDKETTVTNYLQELANLKNTGQSSLRELQALADLRKQEYAEALALQEENEKSFFAQLKIFSGSGAWQALNNFARYRAISQAKAAEYKALLAARKILEQYQPFLETQKRAVIANRDALVKGVKVKLVKGMRLKLIEGE